MKNLLFIFFFATIFERPIETPPLVYLSFHCGDDQHPTDLILYANQGYVYRSRTRNTGVWDSGHWKIKDTLLILRSVRTSSFHDPGISLYEKKQMTVEEYDRRTRDTFLMHEKQDTFRIRKKLLIMFDEQDKRNKGKKNPYTCTFLSQDN